MTQVAFFPFWQHNPYHVRLKRELASLGVEVFGCDTLPGEHEAPDIVHFHGFRFLLREASVDEVKTRIELLLSQLDALIAGGTVFVTTMHDLQNHLGLYPDVDESLTRALLERSHVTIFHSESARARAAKRWGEDCVSRSALVPHPNYIGSYPNKISRKRARKRLGVDPKAFVFLVLGSLRKNKGIVSLLQSFMAWSPGVLVQLVIAGANNLDSPHDKIAEASAADSRIFYRPGYVDDGDLATYLNAADCAVFPFVEITTSGSLVLAMSYGLPVIAPRLFYFADVLDEDGAILYEPTDATCLTSSMATILRRKEQLRVMGERNLAIVKPWHHREIARQTQLVYKSALENKHL